ncbi:MAG: hypothetical protein VB112_05545, partial [Oscillospiraceae bacterium]|nr:hypothetical protein [Oscillospiraceae bacterium]
APLATLPTLIKAVDQGEESLRVSESSRAGPAVQPPGKKYLFSRHVPSQEKFLFRVLQPL